MARIQHLALAVEDPVKTAEYYKRVFGLAELNRTSHGVWLTDGYIYFAILGTESFGEVEVEVGIQHFGFVVDDLEASKAAIESEAVELTPHSTPQKPQYRDPDGILVELRSAEDGFWDRRVGAATRLMKLVPADS